MPVQFFNEIGRGIQIGLTQPTIVFKASLLSKLTFVAVKCIDFSNDARAKKNVEFIAKLKHSHIVKYYRWYRSERNNWLVLEFCGGGSLEDILNQDRILPEETIKLMAVDILSAMFYIHRKNVLFVNYHPRHFLIDSFGFLKMGSFTQAVRMDSFLIGPRPDVEYLAPELHSTSTKPTIDSDFYSFGLLLSRMASGCVPTYKNSHASPLHSTNLNSLIKALLKQNPSERPTWQNIFQFEFWKDEVARREDFNGKEDRYSLLNTIQLRFRIKPSYSPLVRIILQSPLVKAKDLLFNKMMEPPPSLFVDFTDWDLYLLSIKSPNLSERRGLFPPSSICSKQVHPS